MLPFAVQLRPGESPYRQIVFAATKAVMSGELAPGSAFPSVRELSQALKINPNTAHKVVTELIRNGLLQVLPGQGTIVAVAPPATTTERQYLLADPIDQLVVEAKRLGLGSGDLVRAIEGRWSQLFGDPADSTPTRDDEQC